MDVAILIKHKNMPRSFVQVIRMSMLVFVGSFFLEHINRKISFQEQEKSERVQTIASNELGALLSGRLSNYEDLIETIIKSERYDLSLRNSVKVIIEQVPTETKEAIWKENLKYRLKMDCLKYFG